MALWLSSAAVCMPLTSAQTLPGTCFYLFPLLWWGAHWSTLSYWQQSTLREACVPASSCLCSYYLLEGEFPSCHPELSGAGNLARCLDAPGRNVRWHSPGSWTFLKRMWVDKQPCGFLQGVGTSCPQPLSGMPPRWEGQSLGAELRLKWAAALRKPREWSAGQSGSPAPLSPLLPSLSGMPRRLAVTFLWTHFVFTLQVTSTFSARIDFRFYLRIHSGWRFLSDKIVSLGESKIHACPGSLWGRSGVLSGKHQSTMMYKVIHNLHQLYYIAVDTRSSPSLSCVNCPSTTVTLSAHPCNAIKFSYQF